MISQTKTFILQRHHENDFLRTPALSSTSQNERDLSADDFFVPLDENIIHSTVNALEAGQTHYVDVPGIPLLRTALAEYLNSTFGSNYQSANVLVTAGIQEARFLTIQMIGEQFERLAIPRVVYPGVRKAIGVRPMPVELMEVDPSTLLPTLEGVRNVLQAGVRLLYLESPSRLTGAAYDADTLAAIAKLIREYQATVICDQGLAPWTSHYSSLAAQADLTEKVLLIGEAFPGTGLSSWFIGYIAAPQNLIPTMQSQKQIMAICTSTPAQYAALEASKLFSQTRENHVRQLSEKRRKIIQTLPGEKIINGDTATVLALRFSPEAKAEALSRLKNAGYTVADGADFGAPDVLRLTVSHDGALEQAVQQIEGR